MNVVKTHWMTAYHSYYASRKEVNYCAYRRTSYLDVRPDEMAELVKKFRFERISISKCGTRLYWVKCLRTIRWREDRKSGEISRQVFLSHRGGKKVLCLSVEKPGDERYQHSRMDRL